MKAATVILIKRVFDRLTSFQLYSVAKLCYNNISCMCGFTVNWPACQIVVADDAGFAASLENGRLVSYYLFHMRENR